MTGDPFVFKHPQTGRYTMILAARLNQGPFFRRGCTGLLTSDDLRHWTVEKPFYAAKSASDGSRRFLFGWNPTKLGNVDHGEWEWGGCLTVHELVQNDDGTLAVRMPPEAARAFDAAQNVGLTRLEPSWSQSDDGHRAEAPYGYSTALSEKMPETYLLQGEIGFERPAGAAGLLLRVDEAGDTGYFLRFNFDGQRLEFGKIGGYRSWYVDHMPELDRPISIRAGEALRFQIIVDKTAVVAYVNNQVALSARMYANPFGRCGLFVDGTGAYVQSLQVQTPQK